jgi:hypothetical protein
MASQSLFQRRYARGDSDDLFLIFFFPIILGTVINFLLNGILAYESDESSV